MARVLSPSEAKSRLSEQVADCEKDQEEPVITRNRRPAVVLVSAQPPSSATSGKNCKTIKEYHGLNGMHGNHESRFNLYDDH
jgi:hypothetical protein